jgi:hypothetical protein
MNRSIALCRLMYLILLLLGAGSLSAQKRLTSISFETGNAVTAFPFTGAPQLFYSNYHPFTSVGASLVWKEKNKHAWEQSFNLGYIYHRFIQHNIPVFTEIVYRNNISKNFAFRTHLGAGYLHNIPAMDRFELNSQGDYEKIRNLGRAQGMFKLSFSGAYKLNESFSLSINYGVLMQTPFVASYVPLLPYNTLQLGLHKMLNQSSSHNPIRSK